MSVPSLDEQLGGLLAAAAAMEAWLRQEDRCVLCAADRRLAGSAGPDLCVTCFLRQAGFDPEEEDRCALCGADRRLAGGAGPDLCVPCYLREEGLDDPESPAEEDRCFFCGADRRLGGGPCPDPRCGSRVGGG